MTLRKKEKSNPDRSPQKKEKRNWPEEGKDERSARKRPENALEKKRSLRFKASEVPAMNR